MSICEEDRMTRIIQDRTNQVMLEEIRHHVMRLGCTSEDNENNNYLAIDSYEADKRGRARCLISCWTKSITCELQHLFWYMRYLKEYNLCVIKKDEDGEDLWVTLKVDDDEEYIIEESVFNENEMKLPMLWFTLYEHLKSMNDLVKFRDSIIYKEKDKL